MRRKSWVLAAYVALIVATSLLAYSLGKDCGAWEAKQRLEGMGRPALCLSR